MLSKQTHQRFCLRRFCPRLPLEHRLKPSFFCQRRDRREITIGRAETSDLVIDDEFASTNHARLVKLNDEWTLQDLGSTNGTFLDGVKVTSPVAFKVGSEVRIGKTAFELRG